MSVRAHLTHAQIYDNSVYTRSVGAAAFTILVYDYLITLEDEIEFIWKGRKGPIIWLFFLNRYLVPLSFVVNIFAYFSHVWDYHTCSNFVVYEGSMTMIGISVASLMMFMRIKALYYNHRFVYYAVFSLWCVFVGVNSWLLTSATPVYLRAPNVISCTMIFGPEVGWAASASAWIPLLYDTTVLILTLIRTVSHAWHRGYSDIVAELLREGLLYYSVIFSVTLALTIMILAADPSVRNITAQLELCLTSTMMSRITLDLKRFARGGTLAYQREPKAKSYTLPTVDRTEWEGDECGGKHVERPERAHTRDSVGEETSFFAMVTRDHESEHDGGQDTSFFAMVTRDEDVEAGPSSPYPYDEKDSPSVSPVSSPSRKGKEREVAPAGMWEMEMAERRDARPLIGGGYAGREPADKQLADAVQERRTAQLHREWAERSTVGEKTPESEDGPASSPFDSTSRLHDPAVSDWGLHDPPPARIRGDG
ncbi:hypothetical protein PENSPDRAFT_651572 [Peniophora sp. CONT]|nr:hypothetical protein PENSPDRAFT_651572 [Peniophora sp. CONT]